MKNSQNGFVVNILFTLLPLTVIVLLSLIIQVADENQISNSCNPNVTVTKLK